MVNTITPKVLSRCIAFPLVSARCGKGFAPSRPNRCHTTPSAGSLITTGGWPEPWRATHATRAPWLNRSTTCRRISAEYLLGVASSSLNAGGFQKHNSANPGADQRVQGFEFAQNPREPSPHGAAHSAFAWRCSHRLGQVRVRLFGQPFEDGGDDFVCPQARHPRSMSNQPSRATFRDRRISWALRASSSAPMRARGLEPPRA